MDFIKLSLQICCKINKNILKEFLTDILQNIKNLVNVTDMMP